MRKLGEILLARKIITRDQLRQALNAQYVYGGKLGTNLIEQGVIDEKTLIEVLREQQSAEVATPEMFNQIQLPTLRMVPAKVAQRLKAIPLSAANKVLRVAMVDPTDLVAIDELQFTTNHRIVPLMAPEAMIHNALELFYNIPKPVRYVKVDLPRKSKLKQTVDYVDDLGPQKNIAWFELDEGEKGIDVIREERAEEKAEPKETKEIVINHEKLDAYREKRLPPEEMERVDAVVSGIRDIREGEEKKRLSPLKTLSEACHLLSNIDTRDEIAEIVVRFSRTTFKRTIIFLLTKDWINGWLGAGSDIDPQMIRTLYISRDKPSIFDSFRKSANYYLGSLPDTPGNRELVGALEGIHPKNVLLFPLTYKKSVIAVLYGDNGEEDFPQDLYLKPLKGLAARASMAIEMLVLKNRIRTGEL